VTDAGWAISLVGIVSPKSDPVLALLITLGHE
jgi:hypothetical protein